MHYIETAVQNIDADQSCFIENISSLYESKPFGEIEQQDFINLVIEVRTDYKLKNLLTFLKKLETEIGRSSNVRWGPRQIDLDILFYNDLVYSDSEITIPHKGIIDRDFVVVPMCEIAPEFIHPEKNEKICDICNRKIKKNILRRIPQNIFIK